MIKSALQSSLTNDVRYRSMSAGNVPSNEYLIQTTVVGATPVASVEFDVSAYAGIYRHLKVVIAARTTVSGEVGAQLKMALNSTYMNTHMLGGDGTSTVFSTVYGAGTQIAVWVNGASAPSGAFGSGIVDILDPFSTTKNTTIRSFSGSHGGSVPRLGLASAALFSTNSITTITFADRQGANIDTGSRFSLYGVTA